MTGDRVEIDVPLVRRLVGAQFPRWADLPVHAVDTDGWALWKGLITLGEHLDSDPAPA